MPGTDVSYARCLSGLLLSVAEGKSIDGLCVGRREREVAAYGVSLLADFSAFFEVSVDYLLGLKEDDF